MKTGLLVIVVAAFGLSGCTESVLRLSPDFGQALNQDLKAQIADPDAHYTGDPAPGSNGAVVGLAQKRYVTGKVIQPTTLGASGHAAPSQGANNSGNSSGASTGGAP